MYEIIITVIAFSKPYRDLDDLLYSSSIAPSPATPA